MDLETRKIAFIQEFLKLENEKVIAKLEKVLQKEDYNPELEETEPMTMEEFNSRIDESMGDSRKGKLIKGEDLKAQMKKWG